MITDKDRRILAHVSEFNFITIEQARQIAFPSMKRGYEYARTRLQRLVKIEKSLKIIHNTATKQNLYIDIDCDIKTISNSADSIFLMDLYCKMIYSKINVEKFEVNKKWDNGKCKSSALCIFQQGNHRFSNIIEANANGKNLNLSIFDKVKNEIIETCDGKTPRLILIDNTIHREYNSKIFPIIRLNCNLDNFHEILL